MFRMIRGCSSVFVGMAVLAFLMALPLDHALAALVDTHSLKTDLGDDGIRERLLAILARAEVRVALLQQGINPAEVKARIAAMTDTEITDLNNKLGDLPSGGMSGAFIPLWLGLVILLGYLLVLSGVITLGAYAGTKLTEQQEKEYSSSTPFPAPPRVGPLPSVNPNEPWTGKWKVSEGQFKGVFSLKQDGDRVVSTKDSDQAVDAKVYGAMIWGKLGTKQDFKATIASDFLSFKGNVDSRYPVEGQKIELSKSAPEPSQAGRVETGQIRDALLRPGGWQIDWRGPGRIGEGFCLFEARGEKVVAKVSIIDKPFATSSCESDVTISSGVVKFDSCRHSGIVLQFDPNDQVYPFKGRSMGGFEYKLKAK